MVDPASLIVLGGAVTMKLLIAAYKRSQSSPDRYTRNEIHRIGDATIDQMRQTTSNFRDHIDRETKHYR